MIGYKKSENLTFSLSGVFGVTSNVRISEVHAIVREHFSTYSFTFLESPNFQTEEMSKNAVCVNRERYSEEVLFVLFCQRVN